MACEHCGDEHGPTLCRPALALKLAEAIHDGLERDKAQTALELHVASLDQRLHDVEAELKTEPLRKDPHG